MLGPVDEAAEKARASIQEEMVFGEGKFMWQIFRNIEMTY